MQSTRLESNRARVGGGISIKGTVKADISRDMYFLNNTAEEIGGAVAIGADSTVTISHSRFERNQAGRHGGSIHCTVITALPEPP